MVKNTEIISVVGASILVNLEQVSLPLHPVLYTSTLTYCELNVTGIYLHLYISLVCIVLGKQSPGHVQARSFNRIRIICASMDFQIKSGSILSHTDPMKPPIICFKYNSSVFTVIGLLLFCAVAVKIVVF